MKDLFSGAKVAWLGVMWLALILSLNIHANTTMLANGSPEQVPSGFVAGELLVKFKPSVDSYQKQEIVASEIGVTGTAMKALGFNLIKVKFSEGQTMAGAMTTFRANPLVEYVQPNYIYHATATPNDTEYGKLWGLKNTGQTIANAVYLTNNPGAAGDDIDAELAWNEISDCRSTVVAVIDTGIDYTQQDLAANMWSSVPYPNHGYDFVDNDNDPIPVGANEHHGTHVAGTIGAIGNNNNGSVGVCWQAQIMSVRVLGADGVGTTANIISGIQFAVDNNAMVINMSLGGEVPFDQAFSDAITYAQDNDVIAIVAAGNGGSDGIGDNNDGNGDDGDPATKVYPCNFNHPNLVCVAALDQKYNLATFSNYGATSVDIAAPGVNVLSNLPGQSIIDNFRVGWTMTGGWASLTCDFGFGSFDMLTNPLTWCSSNITDQYAPNADDRAYKVFDFSNAVNAEMTAYLFYDTEPGSDYLNIGHDMTGNDPFDGINDTLGQSLSGSSLPNTFVYVGSLADCLTNTCAIGFQLTSNSFTQATGIGVYYFRLDALELGANLYSLLNGTSMASPHVAGIAAMLRTYNPNYNSNETVAAIKNGGEPTVGLTGKILTNKAANAMGALSYINPPTGLIATIQ